MFLRLRHMFVLAVCEFPKCLRISFTTIRCMRAFATDFLLNHFSFMTSCTVVVAQVKIIDEGKLQEDVQYDVLYI